MVEKMGTIEYNPIFDSSQKKKMAHPLILQGL